jgi:hypothetical protein
LDAKEDSIIAEAVHLLIADQIKNNRDLHRRYKAARVWLAEIAKTAIVLVAAWRRASQVREAKKAFQKRDQIDSST